MVDVSKIVVNKLKTILPTYSESFLDSNSKIPCISYFVYSDVDNKTCSTYGWSSITVCVKVWDNGKNMQSLVSNSKLVDKAMRELGFSRVSGTQMKQETLLCNVFNYRCLADEQYI